MVRLTRELTAVSMQPLAERSGGDKNKRSGDDPCSDAKRRRPTARSCGEAACTLCADDDAPELCEKCNAAIEGVCYREHAPLSLSGAMLMHVLCAACKLDAGDSARGAKAEPSGKLYAAAVVSCAICEKAYHRRCGELMMDGVCAACRRGELLLPPADLVSSSIERFLDVPDVRVRTLACARTPVRGFAQGMRASATRRVLGFVNEGVIFFILIVIEHELGGGTPASGHVYISYLDSLPHLEKARRRTAHHGILRAYIRHAAAAGYVRAAIWVKAPEVAAPEYIFWQKREGASIDQAKLGRWYDDALDGMPSRAASDWLRDMREPRDVPVFEDNDVLVRLLRDRPADLTHLRRAMAKMDYRIIELRALASAVPDRRCMYLVQTARNALCSDSREDFQEMCRINAMCFDEANRRYSSMRVLEWVARHTQRRNTWV